MPVNTICNISYEYYLAFRIMELNQISVLILGIKLCQCLPVGVCHLPLCLVLCFGYALRTVTVHSVTLARTDILPEDSHTVTETCRRFYEILAF